MIRVAVDSAASAASLWAVVGDIERWADYLPTVASIRHVAGPTPPGPGSRYVVRQPGLPAATYEITSWRLGEGFTWAARAPGLVSTADHRLMATGPGTRLELTIDWSGPLAPVTRLFLSGTGWRYVESEAHTFAELAAAR